MSWGVNGVLPRPSDPVAPARDRRARRIALAALAAAAGAALVLFSGEASGLLPRWVTWVDGLGAGAAVVFAAGYAVAVVAFMPGSPLTLAAGGLFGLAAGTAVAFAGALTGASAAFLLTRRWVREAIERRLAGDARLASLDRAVGREGWKLVLLLRLSPIFPFNALNYALGLTRVRFRDYVLGSLGMLPGTVLYVYAGRLVGDAARLAGGAAPDRGAAEYGLLGLGLVATLVVTLVLTRLARRALAAAQREGTDESLPT